MGRHEAHSDAPGPRGVIAALVAGTLVLAYRFHPQVVLDAFAEHRPAYTVGPSTAFMALAATPGVTREHFASFEVISSGGAPLPRLTSLRRKR